MDPRPFARILPIVLSLAGLVLGTVALMVVGTRAPETADLPEVEEPPPVLVTDAPPFPPRPPTAERTKRAGVVALLRGGEDLTQYTERLLRRVRGLEEGIERMFARDLQEEEKKRLFELGLGPIDRVEALSLEVAPETRMRIAEDLLAFAADQFADARRLQGSRKPGEAVFEPLLRDAWRFHQRARSALRESLPSGPSKG